MQKNQQKRSAKHVYHYTASLHDIKINRLM